MPAQIRSTLSVWNVFIYLFVSGQYRLLRLKIFFTFFNRMNEEDNIKQFDHDLNSSHETLVTAAPSDLSQELL